MGVGAIFLLLGTLWMLQLILAWQQAQHFMGRARALRRHGTVSIGASPRKVRGRAYVALAVASDGRVAAAEALQGITVFANGRPVPALVGLAAAELAAGEPVAGLHPKVLTAAREAAAVTHPAPSVSGQRPPTVPEGVGTRA